MARFLRISTDEIVSNVLKILRAYDSAVDHLHVGYFATLQMSGLIPVSEPIDVMMAKGQYKPPSRDDVIASIRRQLEEMNAAKQMGKVQGQHPGHQCSLSDIGTHRVAQVLTE